MQTLIPMDDFGVFVDKQDTVRVDSRFVAQFFDKRHDHVLRDIAKITAPTSGLSEEFRNANFLPASYVDSTGRKLRCFLLTRDGKLRKLLQESQKSITSHIMQERIKPSLTN